MGIELARIRQLYCAGGLKGRQNAEKAQTISLVNSHGTLV